MNTICYKCGTAKSWINETCPGCSFEPTSIEELAKATILSEPYCFTTANGVSFETGRSSKELQKISSDIKDGVPYVFLHKELHNVKQVIQDLDSYSGFGLAKDIGKLFGPALALLALMFFILWLL